MSGEWKPSSTEIGKPSNGPRSLILVSSSMMRDQARALHGKDDRAGADLDGGQGRVRAPAATSNAPTDALPAPVRRRIALAAERAAEVDALLTAALDLVAGREGRAEAATGDLDPGAANWHGQLQCLRADLAVPLWRALEEMRHRMNGQDRMPVGGGHDSGRDRTGEGAAANSR